MRGESSNYEETPCDSELELELNSEKKLDVCEFDACETGVCCNELSCDIEPDLKSESGEEADACELVAALLLDIEIDTLSW